MGHLCDSCIWSDFSKWVRDFCSAVNPELCELKASSFPLHFSRFALLLLRNHNISFMTPKCIAGLLQPMGLPVSSTPGSAGDNIPCFFLWFDIFEWKVGGQQSSAKNRFLGKERTQGNITIKGGRKADRLQCKLFTVKLLTWNSVTNSCFKTGFLRGLLKLTSLWGMPVIFSKFLQASFQHFVQFSDCCNTFCSKCKDFSVPPSTCLSPCSVCGSHSIDI